MTMTLEQVRDKLRRYAKDADNYFNRTRETLELTSAELLADAIDAHLAQPAQAVDVGAIETVIRSMCNGEYVEGRHVLADILHRALTGKPL